MMRFAYQFLEAKNIQHFGFPFSVVNHSLYFENWQSFVLVVQLKNLRKVKERINNKLYFLLNKKIRLFSKSEQ